MKNTSKLSFGNKIFNEKQRALELIEKAKKKVNNLVRKRKAIEKILELKEQHTVQA